MNALHRRPHLSAFTPEHMRLTPRQRDVVKLLVEGLRVAQIADTLGCTEATVRAHIQAIAKQLPGPHSPMRRILVHATTLLEKAS